MKEIAIIGPTASGKSALALELAIQYDAYILSIDSLSIYKEIDIVSAKPSIGELQAVHHFGIDEIYPNEYFSVEKFLELYKTAKNIAKKRKKNLILVGGTSFYLKRLLEGLSPMPNFSQQTLIEVKKITENLRKAYHLLTEIDPDYAKKITHNDIYRIQKGLLLYFETNMPPTQYFLTYPPQKITDIPIYEIVVQRDILRQNIKQRTRNMLQNGLIDEIAYLEKKYTRAINPMKAIGIKETLEYLDGTIKSKEELIERIATHTAQLAKRQQTFNKTQFLNKTALPLLPLQKAIEQELAD